MITKGTKLNPQTAQKQQTVYPFLFSDFCLFAAKLKHETGFRRNVFVPKVPRILTSVA